MPKDPKITVTVSEDLLRGLLAANKALSATRNPALKASPAFHALIVQATSARASLQVLSKQPAADDFNR